MLLMSYIDQKGWPGRGVEEAHELWKGVKETTTPFTVVKVAQDLVSSSDSALLVHLGNGTSSVEDRRRVWAQRPHLQQTRGQMAV